MANSVGCATSDHCAFFFLAQTTTALPLTSSSTPHRAKPAIAGLGLTAVLLLLLGEHGVSLGNFLGQICIGKILAAILAVPIFNVALGLSGGGLSLHIGEAILVMVGRNVAVFLMADLAHGLLGAGGGAAGVTAASMTAKPSL